MFHIPPEFTLRYDATEQTYLLDHPLLRHCKIHPIKLSITGLLNQPEFVADPIAKSLCMQLNAHTDVAAQPEPEPAYAVCAQLNGGQVMQMLTSWRTGTDYDTLFTDDLIRTDYIRDILDAASIANRSLSQIITLDTAVMVRRTGHNTYTDHDGNTISPEHMPITASQSTDTDTRERTLAEFFQHPYATEVFTETFEKLYNRSPHAL